MIGRLITSIRICVSGKKRGKKIQKEKREKKIQKREKKRVGRSGV